MDIPNIIQIGKKYITELADTADTTKEIIDKHRAPECKENA